MYDADVGVAEMEWSVCEVGKEKNKQIGRAHV